MTSDIRIRLRSLLKRPGFTLLTTTVVALGVGAAVSLFSIVSSVFLQPLPYPDSERIVWLRERHADVPARQVSFPTFRDWQERSRAFSSMSTSRDLRMRLTRSAETRVLDVGLVGAEYFDVIGVMPAIGRGFTAEDDVFEAPRVAVVSHRFWITEHAGRADVLGTDLTLNDLDYTIVGVAPEGLRPPGNPDAWILIGQQAAPGSGWWDRSIRIAGFGIARLAPGVTIDQARAEMARVQAQLAREYPRQAVGHEIEIFSLKEIVAGELRAPLLVGLGAVAILLLIVCVNVSNLLLLRALDRKPELQLRTALGATPGSNLSQLLLEGLTLIALGSTIGVVLAAWGSKLLARLLSDHLFDGMAVAIDWRVAAFALGLAVAIGLFASVIPVLGQRAGEPLQRSGRAGAGDEPATGRAFSSFLLFQSALAVILLIFAALLSTSTLRILASEPGFDKQGVLTFRLLLPSEYRDPAQLNALYARIIGALRDVGGVESATVFNDLPGLEPRWQSDIAPEVAGEALSFAPGDEINVDWRIVSADYPRALGIAIRQGRTFTDEEVEQGAPVMLVDQALASRFWPDGDAIGSRIRYDGPEPVEIIGIVDDVHSYGTEDRGRITIYTPYGRFPSLGDVGVALRAGGIDPSSLAAPARRVVRSIDPGIAMFNVATLDDLLAERLAPRVLLTQVVLFFACFATLLAALGVYSVMSFFVSRRKRDIGLRIALGADGRSVVGMIVRRSVLTSAAGIAIGLGVAAIVTRLLAEMLFEVRAFSPPTYASVSLLFLIVAFSASVVPAIRAARVNPSAALRAE